MKDISAQQVEHHARFVEAFIDAGFDFAVVRLGEFGPVQARAVVMDGVVAVVAHDPVKGAADEIAAVVPFALDVAAVVLDKVDAQDAARAVELGQDNEEERCPKIEEEEDAREAKGKDVFDEILTGEVAFGGDGHPAVYAGEGVGSRDIGKVNEIEQVPAEIDMNGRCPVGLSVVVEMMMDEVVGRDIGGRWIERSKAQHTAEDHVERAAVKDALVQVVVDDDGV